VHGPLQATLLLNLAVRLSGAGQPRSFTYRGLSPLFDGAAFTVNAVPRGDGFDLWCADRHSVATMDASAGFDE
jgi:3-methylfumaryl-CoA hydratase